MLYFFQRDNIEGAMNNTSFKQTEIIYEIELFSFQTFLKFPSVLANENIIGNNYEKSSPLSSDYAENTPKNEF